MSNLGEVVASFDDPNAKAANTLGAYLGLAADISGGIAIYQLVEDWISTDNSVTDSLNAITIGLQNLGQLLGQLEGQIAGSDKLQRMRDIDNGINPAVAVAAQLPALLKSNPPPTQDYKLNAIKTCVEAVQFFSDYDEKWQVLRSDFPYPLDSFSGWFAAPPDTASPGDLVFNPVYTLPQFLRSIAILLTTIRALEPASLSQYANVFTNALNRLESVHQTVVDTGIMGTRLPDRSDFATTVTSNDEQGQVIGGPNWIAEVGYFPYGGVDIYSGANTVASYSPYLPYLFVDMNEVDPGHYQNFQNLLSLRIEVQKKALYVSMGMLDVRNAINTLLKLLGQSALSTPVYSDWSYAEVVSILGLTLPPPTHPRVSALQNEPQGLEDALRSLLLGIPPYTGTSVLQQQGNYVGGVNEPPIPLPSGSLYVYLTTGKPQPGRVVAHA